ncbi:PadR family transcriptional regulator [Brevibacillus composti]|uniref:PadR family transcriptional regulator n=1 Tax=Brevibacillus composti TaxID=2796470 RepID=A0A7T5EMN1_9BACL|nr:PadR family transcriptional regulator [Brevibacillus composti]QQE75415.1 PadR family transcriptional regulator [Brevibacillus composti]QUO42441.1 PadR family transcriptional regulator [Brevibacillus composti]
MNTLAYGLLGLVAKMPSSGYDLMLQLQPFWQAKHSQIYPLLAKLEQEDYLEFTRVLQTDRPDKKVYSITDKGRAALREWLARPTGEPVFRDELSLKAYCLWLTDRATARKLFEEREELNQEHLSMYENFLAELEQACEGRPENPSSPYFGEYILLTRAVNSIREELNWCRWVIGMLDKQS